MYQKIFNCYQIFLNLNRFKVMSFLFCFISGALMCQQISDKEIFTNEFLSNKRVHYVLKERIKKKEILISDKNNLITNKPLSYSNEGITVLVSNTLKEADLSVQYYIINPDLAYVVLFREGNEGISFIFVKTKNPSKWNFFEYSIRETR